MSLVDVLTALPLPDESEIELDRINTQPAIDIAAIAIGAIIQPLSLLM